MNVTQLKKEIVRHVESSEDENTLLAIKGLLTNEDEYVELSNFLSKKLDEAIREVSEGKVTSHEEVINEIDTWLKDQ